MIGTLRKITSLGLVLGIVAVSGIGAAAVAVGNGYYKYRSAAKATAAEMNFTGNATFQVLQDGEALLHGEMLAQIDGVRNVYWQTTFYADSGTLVTEQSIGEDGILLTRSGDLCLSMDVSRYLPEDTASGLGRSTELMMDAVMGGTKNYFTVADNTVQLTLEGGQVPELCDIAIAATLELLDQDFTDLSGEGKVLLRMLRSIPLRQEVKVERIEFAASITDDGLLDRESGTVLLTGLDAAGNRREITLEMDSVTTGIGSTVPGRVDTGGNPVVPINF